MDEKRGVAWAGVVAGVAALFLTAAAVWLTPLNQDEGWYLYAALETAAGRLPYHNFFFTQGPLLPVVYGWFTPLWSGAGVLGGRVLTAALGLCASLLAARLASRGARPEGRQIAAVMAFTLTACGVYHATFMAIPKTYALAALLFTGGVLALTKSVQGKGQARMGLAVAAGFLLAASAGTRLSLGAALAAAGVWLLFQRRRLGFTWLAFGIGGALGLVLVYGPFVVLAPEGFRFAQTFHTGRAGGGMIFVVGSLARLLRGYLPLAGVAIVTVVWRLAGCRREDAPPANLEVSCVPLWLWAVAAVAAVHLLSPYPYDDYQVPLMPVAAAAAAVWLADTVVRATRPGFARVAVVWGVLVFCGMGVVASPRVQEWVVVRQDRFWVVPKRASDLAVLRRVGASLRRPGPRETVPLLLTPDTYLAVESGRRVPAGLEMGPFGYFPEMDTEQARRLLVLNRERLMALIATTDAPDAATSGYAWAIAAPAMVEVDAAEQRLIGEHMAKRYRLVTTVPDFGQGWTKLEIWTRRMD